MGDSDEEWTGGMNSSSNGGANNNNGSSNNNSNGMNNSNSNNNKRNRDKFYKERDENGSSNQNSSSNNNNNGRRDWNNDNNRSRSNDSWKNNNNNNNNSRMMQGGYGNNNYQRNMGGQNDYPRKYQNNNNNNNSMYNNDQQYKKNNRKDWDGPGGNMDSYGNSHGGGNNNYQYPSNDFQKNSSDYQTQPPLLSFKMFLQQQDDGISDDEAIRRYNDYKLDFKRTQINNFFLEHKEEDWFKSRYYPDESVKRRNEQNQSVINRLDVFMDLYKKGWLDNVSVQADKSKELTRFLDAVVVKLEGGSDDDLASLDSASASSSSGSAESENKDSTASKNSDDQIKTINSESDQLNESSGVGENNNSKAVKRKPEESGSESGAYSDSDNDNEKSHDHKRKKTNSKSESSSTAKTSNPKQLHKTASIFMRNLPSTVTKQDLENLCKGYDGFKRVALSDPAADRGFLRRGWISFESNVDVKKICWNLQSVKIRGLNPGATVNRELSTRVRPISSLLCHHKSVVKNDIKLAMKVIQNMDKRWNLWQENGNETETEKEPEPEKVRAESSQKEKDVGGDEANNNENDSTNPEDEVFNKSSLNDIKFLKHKFNGANPLFDNITDFLVDEIDAEEEELLGADVTDEPKSKKSNDSFEIEMDTNFNKCLDSLVLYLRVVHSVDFYNSIEYQQEDTMPNRCGIIFARPALPPTNAASASLHITQDEVDKYNQEFETKMKPYLEYKERIDMDTAKKLGLKDIRDEVEKFVKQNTQELAPDRWLCPLSGKKFKGPEFIRKHLFYKHLDKINEVKHDVEFFNAYLLDPKRPQLLEHPSNRSAQQQQQQQQGSSSHQASMHGSFGGSQHHHHQQQSHNMNYNMMGGSLMGQVPFNMMQQQGRQMNQWQSNYAAQNMLPTGYGNFMPNQAQFPVGMQQYQQQQQNFNKKGMNDNGGGYGRRGPREMIQYRDLDAPDDN